jgi:hypothetical protein
MIGRVLVATLVAFLSLAVVYPTVDASARPGGFAGARGFHGGFHRLPAGRFVHQPRLHRPFGHRHLVRHPFFRHPALAKHHFRHPHHPLRHRHARHHHRNNNGDLGFPLVGAYDTSVPPYWPQDQDEPREPRIYRVPIEPKLPIYARAAAGGEEGPLRHGCRSEQQTVRSESGGEAQITITRCNLLNE